MLMVKNMEPYVSAIPSSFPLHILTPYHPLSLNSQPSGKLNSSPPPKCVLVFLFLNAKPSAKYSTPQGLEDVSKYPDLLANLLENTSWTEEDIKKLAGLNILRVFKEAEESDCPAKHISEFLKMVGTLGCTVSSPDTHLVNTTCFTSRTGWVIISHLNELETVLTLYETTD
ncbi:unnamed protein product [Timema podura]|uniref:Dipeptidase n=1 Tax=Timema podura TaxID=61482 RepID=A0ABN7NV27_TIMPD|nr:unnamed protein product [Timema podura]